MRVASVACRMNADGCLLLRAGVLLFGASLLNGFVIQATRLPRLAVSAHLVGSRSLS